MSDYPHIAPPKIPLKFLKWFCRKDLIEDVEGDLEELFSERISTNSKTAKLRYCLDVLLLLRPEIIGNFKINNGLINFSMLKNYLKIALRNALRYKGYTALNLMGLVVGIASSLLILLWVQDEVQMDKYHANGDEIYQLFRNMKQTSGTTNTTFSIPKPAADLIQSEYPEVKQVASVSWPISFKFSYKEKKSDEEGRYVTREFLDMFSFPLLEGDKETALNDPGSILISENVAEKFFGKNWSLEVIGKTIRLDNNRDAIITGVFENTRPDSSMEFEYLLPAHEYVGRNDWMNDWGNGSFGVFFTVDSEKEAKVVSERVRNEIKNHTSGQENSGEELVIHKFEDYYLYSNWDNGVINGGRIDYVKILSIIAIFILVVASVNFMNLATARSGRRSKEIGLRKVMGAHKSSISIQFFIESLLLSLLSAILSVFIVWLLLPSFNVLVDKHLFIDLSQAITWYFLGGVTLLVGVFSGIYPALLLPTFNIIQSLKGAVKQSTGAAVFRKGLVVFQFAISTLLIVGTSVIYLQLDYVLNKDLGLDKENLVVLNMGGSFGDRLETYRNEIKKIPQVKAMTVSSGNPLEYGRSTSSMRWAGMADESYEVNILISDEHFIETMGMEIKEGRDFEAQLSDSTNFIINEVMAELMGFDDPINQKLTFWGIKGKVVGVVKNFHMRNMHEPIAPLVISCIDPARESLALVRIQGNPNSALESIEKVNSQLNQNADFNYQFVDQVYEESYKSEMTVSTLANIFAGISIFISCLGLFGLSAFSADQRSKEIGVRKVHGASVSQLVLLLSKDYSKLMILAFLIAVPFAYMYANEWLSNFEFRTQLNPIFIALAGVITFIIGALTVSFKSFQAAKVNPSKTLKDE
ncbi:MAG: ABC transporter permease [Ekhidna sp.]